MVRSSSASPLFLDSDFRKAVEESVCHADHSIEILVGYARSDAIDWLARLTSNRKLKVSIVVGWSMQDLAQGSSDLESYVKSKSLGWAFGIRPGLHAKIFWFDRGELLIGSANLTPRGLHLRQIANIEAGARITPTNVDKEKLSQLLAHSIWLNERLFGDIKEKLEDSSVDGRQYDERLGWPQSIDLKLAEIDKYLWVDDCLLTEPGITIDQTEGGDYAAMIQHDRYILGISESDCTKQELQDALKNCNLIQWLKDSLIEEPENSARFGRLSSLLHDALLDDPKPYRRQVKNLLTNVIAWIKYAEMPDFKIAQHRHTESIHLIVE